MLGRRTAIREYKDRRDCLGGGHTVVLTVFFSLCAYLTPVFGIETSGRVLDSSTELPISGARVRFTTEESKPNPTFVLTDSEGRFVLDIHESSFPTITAASVGYVNGRDETVLPGATDVLIHLRPASTPPDGDPFPFIDPANSSCAGCHMSEYGEWAGTSGFERPSRHATAGQNRWVRDLYDGSGTPGGSGGYLFVRDSPLHDSSINPSGLHTSGLCAECHLPTLAALAPVPGTVKMSDATAESEEGSPERFAYENGVTCSLCHKIDNVNDQLGRTGFFGNGELLISDPGLNFGPLDDSVLDLESQMVAAYHPLHGESKVCAPCHEYNMDHDFDDDFDEAGSPPGQTTYTEWLASPYAALGVQCQDCHMAPGTEVETAICVFGGLIRPGSAVHEHRFEGTTLPYLRAAVDVIVEASQVGSEVHARFEVANVGAGHNFPTGVSVRNAMLVVRARTESATSLPWLPGTDLIPSWGGIGGDANDYGETPGRGFAKVLQGREGNERVLFIDAIGLVENTQIPSGATDTSVYRFDATGIGEGEVTIEGSIVYRRAWKDLAEAKGWIGGMDGQGFPYEGDLLVESATASLILQATSTATSTPTPTVTLTPEATVTPPPTPVASLDAALLLDLIEGWKAGVGSPVEVLVQQSRWFR